jgi:hypothetical protein
MSAFNHAFLCTIVALAVTTTVQAEPPVTHATREFALPEPDLIPEAIAYDAARARWFISSVRQARIVLADGTTFARAPWPVFALAVDSRRHVLWASAGMVPQCAPCKDRRPERTALFAFSLDSGKQQRRIDSPLRGVLGDMLLAPNGDLYLSEGLHGALFRLSHDAHALERLDHPGDFSSPQTPALSSDGKTLYVPDYDRGIAAFTLADRSVHWLKAAAGVEVRGIDGLYLHGDTFIAIQNGTRPERIVGMSSDLQQLAVLESGWDGLGEPTHGALLDGKFYFLANTGWEAYDEHGAKKPGLPPVISTIWSLPLSTLP